MVQFAPEWWFSLLPNFHFGNKAWHNYIVQQSDHTNSTMVRDFAYNKPVLSAEWYMGWDSWVNTPEQELNFAWENMIGGGWVCNGHPNLVYANQLVWDNIEPNSETYLRYVGVMKNFFTDRFKNFNQREPCNALVNNGFACRINEKEFLVYQGSAQGFTLNLSGINATFYADAINCRTGEKLQVTQVAGGGFVSFDSMAGAQEYLVHLYRDIPNGAQLVPYSDEVQIFPNPVGTDLNITTLKSINQFVPIEIFNMQGMKVMNMGQGYLPCKIDVGSFRSGIYMIRLSLKKNNVITKTIIKL